MMLSLPRSMVAARGMIAWCLLVSFTAFAPSGARANSPAIAIAPALNLPHGVEAITGSGFEPGIPVDISVQSSTTTSELGTALADISGSISTSITLPYTIDAGLTNTVVALQPGNPVSASASLAGAPVLPIADSGQVSAHLGDTVSFRVAGFAPMDPLSIFVGGIPAVLPQEVSQYVTDTTGGADLIFTVPSAVVLGPSQILVRGQATGVGQVDTTSIPINIAGIGTLVVTPNPVTAGRSVEIAAAGFLSDEEVALSLSYVDSTSNGKTIAGASAMADANGAINATFRVPVTATAGITTTLQAQGTTSGIVLSRDVTIRAQPSISVLPPGAQAGSSVEVTGSGFQPGERVFVTTPAFEAPSSGMIADTSGSFTDTTSIRSPLAPGVYPVVASGILGTSASTDLSIPRAPQPAPIVVTPQPVDLSTYFAEGFTGDGPNVYFGETLNLLNTSAYSATGSIQYFTDSGITKTVALSIPAHAQVGEDVQQDVGKNVTVSSVLDLPATIAATRTITRTTSSGQLLGSTISDGESALSNEWYFAEGYTGSTFQEYLAVLNPGASPAQVMVEVFGPASATPAQPTGITVAPHSRSTINVSAISPGLSIGLLVTSDQPVAAERVLYWGDGSGSAKYGSSVNSGVLGPAATWTFPYASTADGDQAYLSFIDPSSVAAHVQFSVIGGSANVVLPPDLTVQPGTRATVQLAPLDKTSGGVVAIIAHSDVPIVGEQAQYFGGSPNTGQHSGSVLSGTSPSARWAFAGSAVQGFRSDAWYVLDPGSKQALLTATIFGVDGQMASIRRVVHAGQLAKLPLDALSSHQEAASVVWSSDTPVSIVRVLRAGNSGIGAIVSGTAITQSGS